MRVGAIRVGLAALVLALSAPVASHADVQTAALHDVEEDCLEAVPAAVDVKGVTDSGATVTLDVRVLLDGVSTSTGTAVFQAVAASYSPLGIAVSPTFASVSFTGTDADGLIQQAKALYGGQAPSGVDVVYVLTAKDITLGTTGSSVAGLADCIGGIRYRSRAFAVGERRADDGQRWPLSSGPLTLYVEGTAKIAAHELGHLLGAHHHLANCAEGIPTELDRAEPSACTLMFNDLLLASRNFSTVNGAVVRGHAVQWASP